MTTLIGRDSTSPPGGAGGRLIGPGVRRGLIGAVSFLVLAEVVIRLSPIDTDYLPPTSAVLTQVVNLLRTGSFLFDIITTVYIWILGLVISVAAAVPAGILLGSLPAVRIATRSLVEFLRPIPPVAMIPLAILLFGSGTQMKLALVVYAAVWPILFNTIYALADTDPVATETARAFGFDRFAILRRVTLPSAAPFIATGVRVSTSIALIVTVSCGLLAGGSAGIGTFIITAGSSGDTTDIVLAAATVAGVLGYLGNTGLERLERRAFQWHFERSGDAT